jgi:uncharacterized coiled-coil DUF342 family protein
MPTNLEEVRQEHEEIQQQLNIMSEERNEYRDHVKRVIAPAGVGSRNRGRIHKDSEILDLPEVIEVHFVGE